MIDNDKPVLQCKDISVRYGDVVALSDVSVNFDRGKIHAVVGQNGAGKTTFARVVAGLVVSDTGDVSIDGNIIPSGDVSSARQAGVEIVHQSFALPPSFTVAETMQFGAAKESVYLRKNLEKCWQTHLDSLDINVKSGQRIRDLPVEIQQSVEIARALVTQAKILILDEPTAVLSPEGTSKLFERIRRLREIGVTVILILHKIREVLSIADTVTVLRGGRLVEGPINTAGIDAMRLSELIIGPDLRFKGEQDEAALTGSAIPTHKSEAAIVETAIEAEKTPVLNIQSLSTRIDQDGPALDLIDLKINSGEIVGVAGVEGNGQRTLVGAISALVDVSSGKIMMDGADITKEPLKSRRLAGLRVIPFERNVEGLSLTSPLWQNWSVRTLLEHSLLAFIKPADLRKQCDTALKTWDVHYNNVGQLAGSLSGGNAQKVILAREMDQKARLIIAAQPTRGLDIGATSFVWDALRDAKSRGCGILFISSDLDEIMDVCDRIVVMLSGRIVEVFKPAYDIKSIGAAMTGVNK